MAKKTKLEVYASLLRENYYFKKDNDNYRYNSWKWYDKDHDTIVIWSSDPMCISGLPSFIAAAEMLDLCARVELNKNAGRLEILVH